MAAVQHVFEGAGDPNGVVLVASLGAHFIDQAAGLAWTCVSPGVDGGEPAVWTRPAGGGDDTVIEQITADIHVRFFGKPSTAPTRVGQLCRQIDVNGQVCEWVAYVLWDETLQWRRSVLPLGDWGIGVPDTFAINLAGTDRAYAMSKDEFVEAPIVTTLALPALVAADGYEMLEHGPLPLVIANWSAQTWTVNLDPAAFWQSGGQIELETHGLDAMGITLSQSGPDNSVVSFVVPANTRAWVDLTVEAGVSEGVFGMYCQLIARPLNINRE